MITIISRNAPPLRRAVDALGLVRHITSGHAIGLTLTSAGRVEFERRIGHGRQ